MKWSEVNLRVMKWVYSLNRGEKLYVHTAHNDEWIEWLQCMSMLRQPKSTTQLLRSRLLCFNFSDFTAWSRRQLSSLLTTENKKDLRESKFNSNLACLLTITMSDRLENCRCAHSCYWSAADTEHSTVHKSVNRINFSFNVEFFAVKIDL